MTNIFNKVNVFQGNIVEAKYNSDVGKMHKHNAFIEALPRSLPPDEVASRLRREPAYSEEERFLPAHRRLHCVQALAHYIESLPYTLELEQKVSRVIRDGYIARNPISAEWVKQIRAGFPNLNWGTQDENYVPIIQSTASGFVIIGTSGLGKTKAIEGALSLYPQVIIHTKYNEHSFDRTQLVWLKLDCPYDGSTKGLCLNFFQAIDAILKTRYFQKYGGGTKHVLLQNMALLSANLGIGVLVIDEIQRLNEAASGGAAQMLNFFVQLVNTIGVPVILIGTFKALHLFSKEFAMAKRGSGQGDMIRSNLAKDETWDYFIEGLWKYQWTNVPISFTPQLNKVLYDESQGIIDIAVKLYMLAQWRVIGLEDERITPRIIRESAKESLRLAKPILDALRTKDTDKLSQVNDVYPHFSNLNEYFNRATERINLDGTLNTVRNQQKAANNASDNTYSPVIAIAKILVQAGIEPKLAKESAIKALNSIGYEQELKLLVKEAFAFAFNFDESEDLQPETDACEVKKRTNTRKPKNNLPRVKGDLRAIVACGRKKTIPAYESLKDAGVIKSSNEFCIG